MENKNDDYDLEKFRQILNHCLECNFNGLKDSRNQFCYDVFGSRE